MPETPPPELPRQQGTTPGEDREGRPGLLEENLRLPRCHSLRELSQDYQLFSHAILFQHGYLPGDPLFDLLNQRPQLPREAFLRLKLPRPITQGLEEGNYFLAAVAKLFWPQVLSFLGSLGGVNRDRKFFWRALAQSVPVPDVLLLDTSVGMSLAFPPVVEDVVFFGVDGTTGQYALQPTAYGWPPCKVCLPASPDTLALGQAILQERPDPYAVLEAVTPSPRLPPVIPPPERPLSSLPEAEQESLRQSIRQARILLYGDSTR